MSRFYLEPNLYIFNQTQTFTSREGGVYKKRSKTNLHLSGYDIRTDQTPSNKVW